MTNVNTSPNPVDAAVELARDVYAQPDGGAGGGCHIVLDDGNIEDEHIAWTLQQPYLTDCERRCMETLQELSLASRGEVLRLLHGGSPLAPKETYG